MPLSDQDLQRIGEVVENKMAPINERLAVGDQQLTQHDERLERHSADIKVAREGLAALTLRSDVWKPVWNALLIAVAGMIVAGAAAGALWVSRSMNAAPAAATTRP
jgi:hypothetical protein